MKLFFKSKDGGPESNVTGYWLIEWKSLFSIVLLKFDKGTRDAYHSHAFNSISWILKGVLLEKFLDGKYQYLVSYLNPIITKRDTFHQVEALETTWVFSIRGPWSKTWKEYLPKEDKFIYLTNGRKIYNG